MQIYMKKRSGQQFLNYEVIITSGFNEKSAKEVKNEKPTC